MRFVVTLFVLIHEAVYLCDEIRGAVNIKKRSAALAAPGTPAST